MFVLISFGQIVGQVDNPDVTLPAGFQLVEYQDTVNLADLYWDGQTVKLKPPQPPGTYWDKTEWKPVPVITPPTPVDSVLQSPFLPVVEARLKAIDPVLPEVLRLIYGIAKADQVTQDTAKANLKKLLEPGETNGTNPP
jgi:hypothetical protein